MDDAVRFVRDRLLADGADLTPAYTVTGGAVPDERQLELPGYPGGTDIVGNWVNQQFQLDAFGEALLLFAAAARHDHLDADAWRAAEIAADAIEQRWHEPDAGIWEIDPDDWTHSRLICAAGLRAISRCGPRRRAGRPTGVALADTHRRRHRRRARCTRPDAGNARPTDPRLDAALLLPAIRGAIPADDPRSLATLHAVARRAHRGRLLLPLPPRRTPARRIRRRVPAVRASGWRSPTPNRATTSALPAGSSATAPPADHPACTPRSSTSPSANCAATSRRPSSTRCCSNAPPP